MAAKFKQVSGKQLVKALLKAGFVLISQKGSHIKLRKTGDIRMTVIVPNHKAVRPGTLGNILRTAEFSREDLEKMLR